jgi:hypothetical protein
VPAAVGACRGYPLSSLPSPTDTNGLSSPASAFGVIALAVVFKGRQLRQPGDQALEWPNANRLVGSRRARRWMGRT